MPITIRMPGWPVAVVDTPEEQVNRRRRERERRLKYPIIYETTFNGKPTRLRGAISSDGEIYDYACEYCYQGSWREILNSEIRLSIKAKYQKGVER